MDIVTVLLITGGVLLVYQIFIRRKNDDEYRYNGPYNKKKKK